MEDINLHIVLVGSNPIPAYITCKYLSYENRISEELKYLPIPNKYMFVYSNDTCGYYTNLINLLNLNEDSEEVFKCNLGDNQTGACFIEESITKKLNTIIKKNVIKSISLNNTGGTKPMAVYCTQSVKEFCENENIQEVEIYVDPLSDILKINSSCRSFHINNSNKTWPMHNKLTDYFDLDIENILKLHGFENIKSKDPDKDSYFNNKENIINFVKLILDEKEEDYLKFAEYLQDIKIYNLSKKNKNKVSKLILPNKENNNYTELDFKLQNRKKLMEAIELYEKNKCGNLDWLKGTCKDLHIEDDKKAKKEAKKFLDMITGKWLEEYVYEAINEAMEKINSKNKNNKLKIYWSLEAKHKSSDKQFEIDIVVLKAYKLYAFTITTYDIESQAKLKIFELLHRAEQMGGEHSTVCVVSLLNEDSKIRDDILSFNAEKYKNTQIITKDIVADYDRLVKEIIIILDN